LLHVSTREMCSLAGKMVFIKCVQLPTLTFLNEFAH